MADNVQRDLGRMEADIATIKSQIDGMSQQLDKLVICTAMAKGGYKTLLGVGAVAGAVGGFIAKTISFFGMFR